MTRHYVCTCSPSFKDLTSMCDAAILSDPLAFVRHGRVFLQPC